MGLLDKYQNILLTERKPFHKPSRQSELASKREFELNRRIAAGKLVVHSLLLVYAAILAFILSGLVFKFEISANVFFALSFALLFFTAGQAMYELGIKRAVLFLLASSIIGFLAEVLGTSTGFPFGKYYYTDFLGPKVLGVPEVVPLVWFVISYLTLSIGYCAFTSADRLKPKSLTIVALFCAFGAVSWDFLIDPMFSSYGYWVWTGQFVNLPKLYGIPLTNFIGWFLLITLIISVFFVISRSSRAMFSRRNTWDSRLAYLFLLIDGTIANWQLRHFIAIIIGVTAMLSFLILSYYSSSKKSEARKIYPSVDAFSGTA